MALCAIARAASSICTRVIDTSQTLPLALIGCIVPGSGGFLQIKLQPLGGATDSGFFTQLTCFLFYYISYKTIMTNLGNITRK